MKHLTRRTILAAAPARSRLRAPFVGASPAPRITAPASPTTKSRSATPAPIAARPRPTARSRKSQAAYCKMINDQGGINGRKINFISYDDAYTPPKTVEMARKLVEEDEVLLIASPLGTPTNSAIWHYMNEKKVPQLFVATGATKWDDPKGHPWTIGWQPNYQSEGRIYADLHPEEQAGRQDRRALPERRFRQGLPEGRQGRARRQGVDDHRRGVLRDAPIRPSTRRSSSMKATGCDVFVNMRDPEIRRAGDPQGGGDRLEAAACPQQHRQLGRRHAEAGRPRERQGHRFGFLPEGPDRPEMEGRCRASSPGSPSWTNTMPDADKTDAGNVAGSSLAAMTGAGAEAMRRRPDPRKRHEAGGEPQGLDAADAAARHHGQHQPDRFRAD